MSIGSQLRRMCLYMKDRGLAGFVRRSGQLLWRSTVGNRAVIFCLEPGDEESQEPRPPAGHACLRLRCREELPEREAEVLVEELGRYRGRGAVERYLRDRFARGAELWLLKASERLVCFMWSTRGAVVSPFYLPLSSNDVIVFDMRTVVEFRGRGLAGVLTGCVVASLTKEGARRFYMTVKLWNQPSLRAMRKTRFNRLAAARRFGLMGRRITIWRQE